VAKREEETGGETGRKGDTEKETWRKGDAGRVRAMMCGRIER